ncbi:MAG TPA: hypothetical protein VNY74_06090 [Edaphobacter sp.]|nr:hypothetical protein [Edaphobacter sp.]
MPITPNVYSLQGSQLAVSYATGVAVGLGPFYYQDAHQTIRFQQSDLNIVTSEIGTLVTVLIHKSVGFGSTTFTLLVPNVTLGEGFGPVQINTVGITTLHRFLLSPTAQGQTELYTVTDLAGTAIFIPL